MSDKQENALRDMDVAAISEAKKANGLLSDTWRPYLYEAVANGMIVCGCNTSIFKRGPRKGRVKWLRGEGELCVTIPKQGPFQPSRPTTP